MEKVRANIKDRSSYTEECLAKDIKIWANWAKDNSHNIALYRKPGNHPCLLLANQPLSKVDRPIEELSAGFLFANFNGELWHMPKEQQVEFIDVEHITLPVELSKKTNWEYYVTSKEQASTSKADYTNTVQQSIDNILHSNLNKVVPSKIKLHHLPKGFCLASAFVKLCNTYPTAFISVVSTKEFGTWLTATPELLIKLDNKGIFETMALAGTQKNDSSEQLHDVAWVDKDIEEQAMVSRYIINRFKEIRLREFIEKGPMTVQAGNLNHLCTTFKVDTKATNFQNLGGVMLNLLHPTSAVCGMPKEAALALIAKIEDHDRKFYTGYLGPVNINNETSLYVNLRCMELFKGKANLFAGAGVTAISDPEKEWTETELKFNTLLNIIG